MDIRMRVSALVVAIVAFILLRSHYSAGVSNEEAFYFALLTCCVISTVVTVVDVLLGQMENKIIAMLGNIYHTVASVAMIITGILFLVSVFENRSYDANGVFAQRIIAGILGVIYGLIMANLSWILFRA